jgi:hypothetical protein
MGLDGIMIVFEAEKAFGMDIPDSAARAMRTPRDMVDWLCARLSLAAEPTCRAQTTFYRLRAALSEASRRPRSELTLQTPLPAITTRAQWPELWTAVRRLARAQDWPASLPWPGFLSSGPKTLRDIVDTVLMTWASKPRPSFPAWTRSRVEYTVRRIILEETGQKGFRLTASFVRDLGIS